jgi:leader peptidase (prepilin peptidase) / N-methyltransferase
MVMGEVLVYVWLAFLFTMLFVFGIIIGSFLNVVIVRLPAGQNLMRPPSHCGVCGHLISFWERLPLISYWWLGGRCRGCGAPFSMRYFWVELFTGIGVVALYFLEIGWQPTCYYRHGGFWYLTWGVFPPNSWIIFLYHALLFFFLVVAAGMGAEHGWMPRRLTAITICVGLAGSALMPWPWPAESRSALLVEGWENNRSVGDPPWAPGALPVDGTWADASRRPYSGVQLWPVWGPPPAHGILLGLATSVVGAAVGLLLARATLFPFTNEPRGRPLGAGEGDFLAGVGAVLGWQPLAVAVAVSIPAVLFSNAVARAATGRRRLPLGLVVGFALVIAWFGWSWIGRLAQPVLFDSRVVVVTLGALLALLPVGLLYQRVIQRR